MVMTTKDTAGKRKFENDKKEKKAPVRKMRKPKGEDEQIQACRYYNLCADLDQLMDSFINKWKAIAVHPQLCFQPFLIFK